MKTLWNKSLKLTLVTLGLALIVVGATGCKTTEDVSSPKSTKAESTATAPNDSQDGSLKAIQAKGKIVLGTSADYPPYEFHKTIDGKDVIVGFDIDIAKAIADSLGVELEIVDMKFEGLLPALTGGKIDMIVAGMNPTEERKKSVSFSKEYYEAHQTILVQTGNVTTLNTIESFKGKTLGVQKGTLQETIAAEQFGQSKVEAIGKIPDLIMSLKANKIDGILLAETVAKSYVKNNPDLSVNGMDLGSEGGVAIAMAKDSDELVKAVDGVLEMLMTTGKIDEWITAANELVNQ